MDIREQDRRDFYLFVDEFQNFATQSFIKILSEARKFRLNLMLANQYMAQVEEEVQKAILGNIGTMISFTAGAEDAQILHQEFSEVFSQNDLVNLGRYQVAVKLTIEGQSNRPFLAHTLPLPASRNQNKNKVITVSRERYGRSRKLAKGMDTPKLREHYQLESPDLRDAHKASRGSQAAPRQRPGQTRQNSYQQKPARHERQSAPVVKSPAPPHARPQKRRENKPHGPKRSPDRKSIQKHSKPSSGMVFENKQRKNRTQSDL